MRQKLNVAKISCSEATSLYFYAYLKMPVIDSSVLMDTLLAKEKEIVVLGKMEGK